MDIPVSLPMREGMTLPTALAAPVEEGMMLPVAARPPRQSFRDGPVSYTHLDVYKRQLIIYIRNLIYSVDYFRM